jgi:hypothetical protein
MKSKLIGAVVAPLSILGLSLALGLSTSALGVGEEQQNQDDVEISSLDVTTNIPVAPWCGWYVSGAGDDDLVLEPDDAVSAPTEYIGTEIALTATADPNTAYVGPNADETVQPETEDCSWFTEANKYGARYDVTASGIAFTADALLMPLGVESATPDAGMDFNAESGNPLIITNVGIESCSAQGFSTNATAEIAGETMSTTPWTVDTADVVNNNFCQWSAKYEIKIPGGMSPVYGNVTYRWTGPTLTHTLVIPETQP